MTITLRISQRDILAAQRLHTRPTRRTLLVLLVALPVFCLTVYFLYPETPLAAIGGGIIGLVISQALLIWLYLPYKARRIYRQQKSLHRAHTFSWDDHYLFFQSEDYEGKLRWADLVKVKQNRSTLLLYHSDTLFNFFPRHCFASEAEFEAFRALALARVRG